MENKLIYHYHKPLQEDLITIGNIFLSVQIALGTRKIFLEEFHRAGKELGLIFNLKCTTEHGSYTLNVGYNCEYIIDNEYLSEQTVIDIISVFLVDCPEATMALLGGKIVLKTN